jgi:outer membrane lipoprotein carrier protein
LLKTIESRYNGAKTLEVQFSQVFSAPGRARMAETGILSLSKPGRMRWQYTQPPGKQFVSDGKYFYLYTPGSDQAQKVKTKETEDMRAPLAFLLGRLDFQRDFKRFEYRPEGADTWIVADPKSDNLPYRQVEFAVTPQAQIRRVRVTGHDDSVLDFTFQQERLNPALSARLFEFQPPSGVKIVEALE